ncbi:unnamed protein product [Pleuronectes platessa]|uniref:Uncharacterized protein n=1 Tax=Pleuronectes platessa TaxID=8262 RepID=A0A9N7US92_PLEPL|nr:unnamed protein product [Pleuronectes platessa]
MAQSLSEPSCCNVITLTHTCPYLQSQRHRPTCSSMVPPALHSTPLPTPSRPLKPMTSLGTCSLFNPRGQSLGLPWCPALGLYLRYTPNYCATYGPSHYLTPIIRPPLLPPPHPPASLCSWPSPSLACSVKYATDSDFERDLCEPGVDG